MSRIVLAAVFLGSVACDSRAPGLTDEDLRLAAHVTGVWDATLVREEAWLDSTRRDTLFPPVHGALTLLETSEHSVIEGLPKVSTHVGVYDIPMAALRIALPSSGKSARVFASVASPDSVVAQLRPDGASAALVLQGRIAGDSIGGRWTYAGRSVGGLGGTFVLHRRRQ